MNAELACLWVIGVVFLMSSLVYILFGRQIGAWLARVFFGDVPGGRG